MHFLLILATALSTTNLWAATETLSAKGGQVDILAVGRPSFVKIHGVGAAILRRRALARC